MDREQNKNIIQINIENLKFDGINIEIGKLELGVSNLPLTEKNQSKHLDILNLFYTQLLKNKK